MQRIIDVACEACRKAENAGLLSRGRLRRAAARTVAEQSELLRRTAPWLKDAAIPGTYAGAAAYRDEASRITLDHVRKPFQERIDRLSGRLAGERFNQRFAERLERNLDAARTLKPRRHRNGTRDRNAKGRHPKTPARNLERHPYQRVTDTPSTPEPSAVAMRIHGPAATGVYVTPLIAKVICPDLLPVV